MFRNTLGWLFSYDIVAPHYVKALLDPEATWTSSHGVPYIIDYTFHLPSSPQKYNQLLARTPSYVNPLTRLKPLHDLDQSAFESGLRFWESVTNIRFTKDQTPDATPVFRFKFTKTVTPMFVEGYGAITNVAGYALLRQAKGFLNRDRISDGIGFNEDIMRESALRPLSTRHCQNIKTIETMYHEIGHWAFGFKHPFGGNDALTTPSELLISFSSQNYMHEIETDRFNIYTVISTNPSPADIEAAEFVAGRNMNIGRGNSVYHLKDYVIPDLKICGYRTLTTIVDRSGSDTLSAEGINTPVTLNIRKGENARSSQNETSIRFSYRTDIENVHAGNGHSTIVLNGLSNTVYAPDNAEITVHVNPKDCNHDTIVGFNHGRLVVESASQENPPAWKVLPVGPGKATIDGKEIDYQQGTKIVFDEKNSVTLANTKPENLLLEQIFTRPKEIADDYKIPAGSYEPAVLDDLLNIFSGMPSQLFKEFKSSLANGMLMNFLTNLTEIGLLKIGCTPTQIRILNLTIQCLTALYSGNALASAASLLTGSAMYYCGFSERTCNFAATITSKAVNAANHFTPYGLAKIAASTAGSYIGGKIIHAGLRFTNWAPVVPPPPPMVELEGITVVPNSPNTRYKRS